MKQNTPPGKQADLKDRPKSNAGWREWVLCLTCAIFILVAGALSPIESRGTPATPPSSPVFRDGEVLPEGGCNLYCPDSRSDIVWLSSKCAICCYRDFPFTCSTQTCCQ
jgi:hypothetical protein